MVCDMKRVTVSVVEEGEKLFICSSCGEQCDIVETETHCCEKCISIWSKVVNLTSKKGGK